MRKLVISMAAVLTLCTALAAQEAIGRGGPAQLEVSHAKSGPYQRTGPFSLVVDEGAESAFLRIKNRSDTRQRVVLTDERVGYVDDYIVKWFRGKENVTKMVESDGYAFRIAPKEKRGRAILRMAVKPAGTERRTMCVTPEFVLTRLGAAYSYPIAVNDDSQLC